MGRRGRRGPAPFPVAGDPGKDLFAYLFLMMMVFSFMLMMTLDRAGSPQKAPDAKETGSSALVELAKGDIGTLEKQGSKLLLRFADAIYDPEKDFQKLDRDKKIKSMEKNGKAIRVLYIEKKDQASVSLFAYLETFQVLSRNGVSIAFAEKAVQ